MENEDADHQLKTAKIFSFITVMFCNFSDQSFIQVFNFEFRGKIKESIDK